MMMMKRGLNFNRRKNEGVETTSSSSASKEEEILTEWEMRPGGMLVQKRSQNSEVIAVPNLRIRVEFGEARYQISANSKSSFGELKKLLTVETGLQPCEQRLMFRGKERENSDYLDKCGVKNRSKVILMEDPGSKHRRLIETRRIEKTQAVHRMIEDVTAEVDRLAEQVVAIEKSISNGHKVAELQITTLIELLMRKAVKLDGIQAADDGDRDACANKDLQGRRVQKCVETLDVLKVSNSKVKKVVVTTRWETFDPATATRWELFD